MKRPKSQFFFLIVLLLFLLLIILMIWVNHGKYRENLIQQWKEQLHTSSEISSVNIKEYLRKYSENLVLLAKDPLIIRNSFVNKGGYCPLSAFYQIHHKEIDAILLIDNQGLILNRFPVKVKGESLQGQKCLLGVENEKQMAEYQVRISSVFTNKKGQLAIGISCPVFIENHFAGIIRLMTSLNTMTGNFIAGLRFGDEGYATLSDPEGILLYHPQTAWIARKTEMKQCSGSKGDDLIFNNISEQKELQVWRKVYVGDNAWILRIHVPYHEIMGPVSRHANNTILFAGLIFLIFSVIVLYIMRVQFRRRQLEQEKGMLIKVRESEQKYEKERKMRLTALIEGQEQERIRISREMHDGLGQYLLSAKIRFEDLQKNISQEHTIRFREILDLFNRTVNELKQISKNLMPVELEELGLESAIKNLCLELAHNSNMQIDFVSYGDFHGLKDKTKTHVYRIVQEALNNAGKHADASEINVQLLGGLEKIRLIIQDNGKGFNAELIQKDNPGLGLNNIKERVLIMNGVFRMETEENQGVFIDISIPKKE
jgi:signal transduction histidine kinase